MRLIKGDKIPVIKTRDIYGRCIDFKELEGDKTYVGFLRNVDCLFCNIRINSLLKDIPSLKEKGLRVILFVQNDPELVKDALVKDRDFPFLIIADPRMKFYKKFGVENSFVGMLLSMLRLSDIKHAIKMGFKLKFIQRGKMSLMPADFLIKEDLTVDTVFYGKHTGDHLTLSKISEFVNKSFLSKV